MTTAAIKEKLHAYIDHADDKKVKALYTILGKELTSTNQQWWENEDYLQELDKRALALDTGKDAGTLWQDGKRNNVIAKAI